MSCMKYLFTFFFVQLLHNTSLSQQQQNDTVFYLRSVDSVIAFYTKQAGPDLYLYSGREYYRSQVSTAGFPFFEWEGAVEGSVFYNGNLYRHLGLQYDIAKDELVIENYLRNNVVKLVPEKIGYFTLGQHIFINFKPDENTVGAMNPGFYEILSSGKITVLARHEKKFTLPLNPEDKTSKYAAYNFYYVQKNGIYHPVADKKDLLELLKDKKGELKKFIRSNNIRFNKDMQESILKITGYYSQLIN